MLHSSTNTGFCLEIYGFLKLYKAMESGHGSVYFVNCNEGLTSPSLQFTQQLLELKQLLEGYANSTELA